MSIPDDRAIDAQPTLVDEILAVGGVADVYSPHAAIRRIPSLIIPVVPDAAPQVAVTMGDDGAALSVRIATAADRSTRETAQLVADLLLTATEGPVATVSVEVARIH